MSHNMPRFRQRREPRKCTFCGGGKMGREHFWSEWAAPLLPNGPELSYRDDALFLDHATGQEAAPPRAHRRQGSVISRKIKTVCRDCNSGWMNRLEQAARADITALATDTARLLDAAAQERLARWVIMKVMVSEGDHRGDEVSLPADRQAIKAGLPIPSGITVLLFRCGDPDWRSTYLRQSLNLHTAALDDPYSGFARERKNLQQVTFGFGEFVATCMMIRVPGLRFEIAYPCGTGVRIWPPETDQIHWPPEVRIDAARARFVAENLTRFARRGPAMLPGTYRGF